MNRKFNFVLLASLVLLTGCVISVDTEDWKDHEDWYDRQHENAAKIEHINLGDSEVNIRSEFGNPDFVESFRRGSSDYLVLFYRTHHISGDGVTTRDETTPLVFVDGSLVGWGESAIEHALVEGE